MLTIDPTTQLPVVGSEVFFVINDDRIFAGRVVAHTRMYGQHVADVVPVRDDGTYATSGWVLGADQLHETWDHALQSIIEDLRVQAMKEIDEVVRNKLDDLANKIVKVMQLGTNPHPEPTAAE